MKLFKLLLIFLTYCAASTAVAQEEEWIFDQLSLKDGLSNTFVNQVFQDSEGYPDQFGGEKGKKYKYKKLKDKLIEVCSEGAGSDIEEALNEEMKVWIRGHEQVDDICIVGIKV